MRLSNRWAALFLTGFVMGAAAVSAAEPGTERRGADAHAEEPGTPALPPLPEGLASFGAAVAGDALYVYGGHIGRTHQHSVQNLSHHFRRLDLRQPEKGWQELGEVKGLQGLALVAHGRKVCRIGGLDALNEKGEDENLVSTPEAACFDIDRGEWIDLPDLPLGRSSHDAAVLGDEIFVVGGWQLRGAGEEPLWHETALALDLSAESPSWRSIEQPFTRRALAVAAAGDKVYAFGGLGTDGTSRRVDVLDPATGSWTEGPLLPESEGGMKGFGVSAFGFGEMVLLSGGDGAVHAHRAGMEGWLEGVGQLEQPRFFHRLLPHEDRVLFVAGAHRGGHLGDIETVSMVALRRGAREQARASAEKPPGAEPRLEVDRGTWPGFRGPGDGHHGAGELPTTWSEQEGVAWRVKIPGYGQSVPVVWGSQVFATSVEGPQKETLILSSYGLEDGEVLWRRRFDASQHIENSDMYSRGAPTPVLDADRLYVFWESGDVIAFDHGGETLWRRSLSRDYGELQGNHGIASSPVLVDGAVVLQVTHGGPSYYVALDREAGSVIWKVDRDPGVAWTTPTVIRTEDGQQIISSAAGRVEALDAATGERVWHYTGVEKNNVPSASVAGDRVLVGSSSPSHNMLLRRGTGELGADDVVWSAEGVSSGFSSPLFHGGCALITNRKGVLTCLDAESGQEKWKHKLSGGLWASPIVSGDQVFFFTEKGITDVLRFGSEKPEVVASNRLPTESRVYGVAAVRGALLLRTGPELIRVGQ